MSMTAAAPPRSVRVALPCPPADANGARRRARRRSPKYDARAGARIGRPCVRVTRRGADGANEERHDRDGVGSHGHAPTIAGASYTSLAIGIWLLIDARNAPPARGRSVLYIGVVLVWGFVGSARSPGCGARTTPPAS